MEIPTHPEKSAHNNVSEPGSCLYDLLCTDTPSWRTMSDRRTLSGPQERLDILLHQSANKSCADCGSPDPKWVVPVYIEVLEYIFQRRKYEMQEFLDTIQELSCPFPPTHKRHSSTNSSGSSHSQDKKQCDKQPSRHRIGHAFRNSWGRRDSSHHRSTKKGNTMSMAGMVEFVGLIKVNVVRGTNLVVRDVVTSDPYVILSLGQQSVKTRVIKNNLNPVWNERLMLSIPEQIPPLKVLVYDKDTFSTDDYMGEAEIDIQPLVTAAIAFEKSSINEATQVGKLIASNDNTLVKDGVINLIDGKVRQQISLRLQNVERGVLEIELECVPLNQ